jgi:hypothetical protein
MPKNKILDQLVLLLSAMLFIAGLHYRVGKSRLSGMA